MLIKSTSAKASFSQPGYSATFVKRYINPLTYRLLGSTIRDTDINEDNYMNECCRLAALIFLSKIRRKFKDTLVSDTTDGLHGFRIVHTGIEMRSLKSILATYASHWIAFRPLLLWVLLIGALEATVEGPAGSPVKVDQGHKWQDLGCGANSLQEFSYTDPLRAQFIPTSYQHPILDTDVQDEKGYNRERDWWVALLVNTAQEMGIEGGEKGWADIVAVAGNLLWVGEVLDRETELLGKEVMDKFPAGATGTQTSRL